MRAWARVSATLYAVAGLVALAFSVIALGRNLVRAFGGHVRDLGCVLARRCLLTGGIHVDGTCLCRSISQSIAEVDRRRAPASRVETPRFEAPPEHPRPNCLAAEEQLRDVSRPQAASVECALPEAEPCAASGNAFARTETAPAMLWLVSLPPVREAAATALP